MRDFETHPRGTAEEIKLSRALYNTIEQLTEQWGERIISPDILRAHDALTQCYMRHMEKEKQ